MPDGLAVGKSGGNSSGHETVIAIQLGRGNAVCQFYQVVELYHVSLVATDVDTFQVGRLVALLTVDFSQYLVLLSIHIEVAHTLAAQTVLQCLGDVAGADTHDACLVAVDVDAGFRLAELQVYVRHLEYRILIYLCHELGQHFLQFLNVGGLQHILYGHTAAPSAEG